MGSELGSLVAALLEAESWVGSLEGIDLDPPRRRLRRAVFHRIDPHHSERVFDVMTRFDPHVVVHVAVWEPDARANTAMARRLTDRAALSILGAAAECPSLQHLVIRSAAEVYGRSRGSFSRPDESAPIAPTTEFGRMAQRIEAVANDIGARTGVTVGSLRLASVLGPHVPSPLGRVLAPARRSVQPHRRSSFRRAARSRRSHARWSRRPNEDCPSQSTSSRPERSQRSKRSGAAGDCRCHSSDLNGRSHDGSSHLFGSPVPDHVTEVLLHGRLVDGGRATELIGVSPASTTPTVIDSLYDWPSVVHVMLPRGVAADEIVA